MKHVKLSRVENRVTGVHQGWRVLSPDGRELVVQTFGPTGSPATPEELEDLRAALVAMLEIGGDVHVELC